LTRGHRAVTANAASQELIESQHNTAVWTPSAASSRKLMQYTATMATIKELYKLSMENVSGFVQESQYYVEMAHCVAEFFKDVPFVLKYMSSHLPRTMFICLNEIMDIVLENRVAGEGLCVDIVNNGKVQNPIKKSKDVPKCRHMLPVVEGDGYNFIDRYERLTLANRIYTHLLEIRYKMEAITMMCQYCSDMNNLLMAIDCGLLGSLLFTGKNIIVEGLINDWEGLGV
jgi:hypothetical protein